MDMQRKQKTHVAAESGELTNSSEKCGFKQIRTATQHNVATDLGKLDRPMTFAPESPLLLLPILPFRFGNTATLSRTQQDGDNSHVRWEKQQSVG